MLFFGAARILFNSNNNKLEPNQTQIRDGEGPQGGGAAGAGLAQQAAAQADAGGRAQGTCWPRVFRVGWFIGWLIGLLGTPKCGMRHAHVHTTQAPQKTKKHTTTQYHRHAPPKHNKIKTTGALVREVPLVPHQRQLPRAQVRSGLWYMYGYRFV